MCIDSRPLSCPGVILLLLILRAAWPVPGNASCFITRLPDHPKPAGAAASPLRLAHDGEDLLVGTRWPAEPAASEATFVLSTPATGMIGSWPAEPAAGKETEQRLEGALARVATAGFQYLLELQADDALLGRLAFRVAVSCEGETCDYRLIPGLTADPIAVSSVFWNALDEARADGSQDLLANIRDHHPEAAGEIPSFAWQLSQVEPEPGGGCHCRWLAIESQSPGAWIGPRIGSGTTHKYGINSDGAGFEAGVQATAGAVTVSRNASGGDGLVGLQLLCTRYHGASMARYSTPWPSMPLLEIPEPNLSDCSAPCTPLIEHFAQVSGCAQGVVASRQGMRVQAKAEVDAGISLNGRSTTGGIVSISLDVTDDEVVLDHEGFGKTSTALLPAEGAYAELSGGALIHAEVEPPASGPRSYAFAAASVEYLTWFIAPELCGIEEGKAFLTFYLGDGNDGGVAMERWEDPP